MMAFMLLRVVVASGFAGGCNNERGEGCAVGVAGLRLST